MQTIMIKNGNSNDSDINNYYDNSNDKNEKKIRIIITL